MAALEHPNTTPTLTCADVTQCSICHWYPLNKKHTFKTIVVPASRAFVEFLGSDGPMVIPETAKGARVASRGRTAVDDDCELSDDESAPAPRFPDDEAAVDAAIAELGGVAFCKLNWSAPRDAAWLTGGRLQCECAGDVFALLAASEFARHDVGRAYDGCGDGGDADAIKCGAVVALRAWRDLEPSREFRCFLLDGVLVAACQRRVDEVFEEFDDDDGSALRGVKAGIARLVDAGLDVPRDCVLDVALDGRRAYLVDVGPSVATDPLLFAWPELLALRPAASARPRGPSTDFELRVVDADSPPVMPSELSSFRAPLDVAEIARAGGLDELLASMRTQRADDSSSSDDD